MRIAVLLALVACSKSEKKPDVVEEKRKMPSVAVRPVCPTGVLNTHPWLHEVFPGCPPPQHWTDGVRCDGACPKPCRITSQMFDMEPHTHQLVYDDAGRWIGDEENAEVKRGCEYDDKGMKRCRNREEEFSIERDDKGRIVRVDGPEGVVNRFAYDERGRVIETYEMLLQTSKLEYDAAGWLLRERRSGLFVDRDAVVTYHYDDRGLLTDYQSKEIMHPGAKRIPFDHGESYAYDASGRLVEASGGGVQETYAYDAKGRVLKYVRENTDEKTISQTETVEYCD